MGDFIKELTIIDFLGMIVPGSLLIVLFTKDYELQSIWGDYFGNDTVANTIILLIAGYLIGMLIHELGDLLEKQLWKMSRLNPRYYAAKEVFLNVEKNINTLIKEKCKENDENDQDKKQLLLSVFLLEVLYLALFFLPVLLTTLKKEDNIEIHLLIAFAIVAICVLSAIYLIRTKNSVDASVVGYLKQNAAIQIEVFGKATAAKRQIFDGFYCVMRNFLIVIGITNIYSVIMLIFGRSSHLLDAVNIFYQDWIQVFIYCIVVVGILHRCWHYACLKYKYTYEDYLYILKEKEKQPSSNNKSMVISMSNRG